MGIINSLLGLLNSSQANQHQEPATVPVSSPAPQSQQQQQPKPKPQQQPQQQQSEALSSSAKMITDIIAPAIVTLAGNEEGEQRAKHVMASTAVLTEQASRETARVYDNLEKQRGAQEGLVDAQQLSQLMQLDQIAASDERAMEANQLFREQVAPINAAISEDTSDLGEARALQNSGNPLAWVWGKLKEEYNNETLTEAMNQKAALQQSAQVNFALNTAERALTSKKMAEAGKREIIASSLVKKLQANENISAKEIDFIAKQLDLNHKEVNDIMSTLNYDLSKQQLSIQKAHLALAQAQEKRQKEQWKLGVAQYKDATSAGEETYKQLKALGLADKAGTSKVQIMKAYTNPSAADALTIQAITTGLGGGFTGSIFNDTGVANLRYEDIANNPTLAATNPEFVEYKNATDSAMQQWLATPEGMTATAEQKAMKQNSYLNQVAESYAQDGQRLLNDGKMQIPTIALMADTQKNFAVYNQKALEALKTLQTTLSTPNDNNSFFESVVDAAEKNGVGLDVMAQQLAGNYTQMVAENRRAGAISVLPRRFIVGLADNYTGSYNALSGTFSKRAGAVDLLSPKDIHNLLKSVSKRRKTAAEMQAVRAGVGQAMNYQRSMGLAYTYLGQNPNIKTEY